MGSHYFDFYEMSREMSVLSPEELRAARLRALEPAEEIVATTEHIASVSRDSSETTLDFESLSIGSELSSDLDSAGYLDPCIHQVDFPLV